MSNANSNLRRSKRLSSRIDIQQEPHWVEDGTHSLHRSAQKSRRIHQSTNQPSHRAPLGDITRGSTNRPQTRAYHQSPLQTGIDTSNVAFFSISSVHDLDGRHDLNSTKVDDDEDDDDDRSSLDRSFDDDDMIVSANKQRQQHERHLAEKSESNKHVNQPTKQSYPIVPIHHAQQMNVSPSNQPTDQSNNHPNQLSLRIDSSQSSSEGSQPMDMFSPLAMHQPIPQPPAWATHECLKENGDILFRYLRRSELEDRYQSNPCYMTDVQNDLSFAMRAILIDWLVEVCEEYSLSTQTLFLGVGYLDRFLSIHQVDRSRLQLIGVTSIFIASKYWEIKPPLVDDFVYISDHSYTRQQVIEMEHCLLNALRFNLAAPTCWDFHRRYLSLIGSPSTTQSTNQSMFVPDLEHFGDMCMELILCEPGSLTFKPSEIASAALLYAHWVVQGTFWTAELATITRYNAEDLNNAVTLMEAAHMKQWQTMQQHQANRTCAPLKAVMIKYSKPAYNRVALTQAYRTPPS